MMQYIRENKNLEGKTVLLRADLDAPHEGANILNDYRIRMALATIEFLYGQGAKVIILSKTGRPKTSADWASRDLSESLKPAAELLAQLLHKKPLATASKIPVYDAGQLVFFTGDIRLKENQEIIKNAAQKDIILLDNMRFYPEEEGCDREFGKVLASLGDLYVNDAFAVSHRAETSVTVLPTLLPAYAGLNLENEIKSLDKVLKIATRPFVLIMAGIKISDKIGILRNLGKSADAILIGGGLANLFFKVKGYEIGKSRVETEKADLAEELLRNYKESLILPVDVVVAKPDFSGVRVCAPIEVKSDEVIFDIGPETILEYSRYIKTAQKMVWNGPMGFFEQKQFSNGTKSIALIFASKCDENCFGVVGGGDTLEAIEAAKVGQHISFISTGGGAMLEYLAGETLPGIAALN